MIKDLSDGVLKYLRVIQMANQFKLWKYLFYSGIFSILAGALIFFLAYKLGDNLGGSIFSWYKWDFGSKFIDEIEDWIGGFLIGIFAILIFKYIVLIISSPFMSFASEQLERQLTAYPAHSTFSMNQAIKDLNRGIILNVRNLFRELIITAGLLILGLFPPIGIVVPVLIFIIQAYYAGFGNLDFFMERHFNVKGAIGFVRSHRLLAIGNGSIFLVLLLIPVLGWFIAPFFATIAGTLAAMDRIKK